jgi:hypothetical protein
MKKNSIKKNDKTGFLIFFIFLILAVIIQLYNYFR